MDAIREPLSVIRALYEARSEADPHDFGVKTRFNALMDDPVLSAQIPILTEETAELLPNQCLVRYRGLVQDMLNPEYYLGEFQRADGSWATAKFADQLDEPLPEGCHGSGNTRISERRPLMLMPVPGESAWDAAPRAAAARASLAAVVPPPAVGAAAAKRPREQGGCAEQDAMSVSMMASDVTGQTTADDGDSAASRSRPAPAPGQAAQAEASGGGGGDLPPGCCMAYLYDEAEVKLNDVVEVVGVLSRVPELAAAHMAAAGGGGGAAGQAPSSLLEEELLAAHLPTSKVSRLHAVLLRPEASGAAPTAALPVAEARGRALGFLSQLLGGDDLAAEYLLLQLVGRVHHRTPQSAVGVLALNLVLEPGSPAAAAAAAAAAPAAPRGSAAAGQRLSPLGAALAAALSALSPRCVALPLSVPALNARPWWPRRDQGTQRLISGRLQLAGGTQVLLDETALAAGTLNEVGLRNLAALQTLASGQRVPYDFEFFSLDQPADAPVTVLSLGRSLLKDGLGVALPLRPTAPLADAAAAAAAAATADLAPLHAFLAAARAADFSISPDTEAFLQQELAGARQKDRDVNEQTFHTWMNMARLLALSHGEGVLSRERWSAMRSLEERRRQRLAAGGSSA